MRECNPRIDNGGLENSGTSTKLELQLFREGLGESVVD